MENLELVKQKVNVNENEIDTVNIGVTINTNNPTGNIDQYKVLSSAKLMNLTKFNTVAVVNLVWHTYKNKESFLSGKMPTFEAVEQIEFPKENLFQLINLFYQLQSESNQ